MFTFKTSYTHLIYHYIPHILLIFVLYALYLNASGSEWGHADTKLKVNAIKYFFPMFLFGYAVGCFFILKRVILNGTVSLDVKNNILLINNYAAATKKINKVFFKKSYNKGVDISFVEIDIVFEVKNWQVPCGFNVSDFEKALTKNGIKIEWLNS